MVFFNIMASPSDSGCFLADNVKSKRTVEENTTSIDETALRILLDDFPTESSLPSLIRTSSISSILSTSTVSSLLFSSPPSVDSILHLTPSPPSLWAPSSIPIQVASSSELFDIPITDSESEGFETNDQDSSDESDFTSTEDDDDESDKDPLDSVVFQDDLPILARMSFFVANAAAVTRQKTGVLMARHLVNPLKESIVDNDVVLLDVAAEEGWEML